MAETIPAPTNPINVNTGDCWLGGDLHRIVALVWALTKPPVTVMVPFKQFKTMHASPKRNINPQVDWELQKGYFGNDGAGKQTPSWA